MFEKLKEKNYTSVAINGGAIFSKLFINTTKRIETEGGNVLDLMVADELGFKAIVKELEEDNFDAYFIHLAGIDHAGHNGGVKEPKLYNMTIESVDDKL